MALWWLAGDPALGPRARSAVESADQVFVSAVTPWELGIERAFGKIAFPDGLVEALVAGGFSPLPITAEHAQRAPVLPDHHRDPFDRLLVAQAQLEALTLVTADRRLQPYDVEIIDARG